MKKAVYSLTLIWTVSLINLVPRIDNFNYDFIRSKGIAEKDIFFRTLGEAKALVSDLSYLKADEYYHGGVKHKDLEPHICPFRDKNARREEPEHKHACKKKHGKEKFPGFNILPRIGGELSIHAVKHLHGEEEKEVMPWLYYSVKLNPHNVEAYVVGAYWVGCRLGKADEALKFLREGMKHNPDAWQIYSEAGGLYFHQKQNYIQAIKLYSKAESLMSDKNADKFDKSHTFTFLGASYEKIGKIDRALEYYRKDVNLFPSHRGLIKKIKKLEGKI